MDLYKDKLPAIRKEAAFSSRVSETPEDWPQELTNELYKQLPYLSDYDVNVNLDRVEPQRGFAFGWADVHNKTERPEQEHAEVGLPHIRIPLVVQEHMVRPFAVMLDGEKVLPLNEDRVREQLFNPSAFDLSITPPVDPSLVEPLMPPHRSGIGMGGDYKLASADEALLSALRSTDKAKTASDSVEVSDESFWLKKFKGTPFEERARQLEAAQLRFDLVRNRRSQETIPEPPKPAPEDPLHKPEEALRLKRRELELLLQLHNLSPKDKEAFAKAAADLTAAARGKIPTAKFAIPEERKYPIHDAAHARNALARVSQHGTPEEKSRVRHAVARQKPGVVGEETKQDLSKTAFKHISKEQWDAMYNSLEVQKLLHEYSGNRSHPAVQNKVYEIASKLYGFHPKPEPPPPAKVQEFQQKQQEKAQKTQQKQTEKAKKMLQEGTKLMSGAKKTASVEEPMLLKIAHTIRAEDWQDFVSQVSSDPDLRAGFKRAGVRDLLLRVEEEMGKTASLEDRLQVLAENIAPTVVTIQKLPGGDFLVKSANNEAFVPGQEAQGEVVPQAQMAENIGQDQAQAMLPGQTATAVADPAEVQAPAVPSADTVGEFGEYLVQDLMGNQVMGWVFPTTLAWDGQFSEQPVALFTNGSAFAVQDSIAGELVGKSPQLPMGQPRGEGVFYEVSRDGARATAPVTIRGGMTGPDGGEKYSGADIFGNQFTVHLSEGLTQPMQVADNEYALPNTWKFMALNNQTQLVPDGTQMNKTSAVRQEQSSVTLFWNGAFNFVGGCGLDKLASSFRQELDPVSAEFMLGLLGVPGADAKQKLAEARKKGSVKIAGLKTITTLGERYAEMQKEAAMLAAKLPNLKRDLVKEAASLDDEATVDKVLALNFVNPENLSSFVEHLPELEQTSENLASMLLSSYLGMGELPEASVEKAMRGMEEVVLQLKAIQHAEA